MTRATIIVEKWCPFSGWQHDKGFPGAAILAALAHAKDLESTGAPARVIELTPEGPRGIYESPKS